MSVGSVLVDIVKGVIAELRGKDVGDWTTDKVAAAIADKVKEAVAATIATELKSYAAALDIRADSDSIVEAADRILMILRGTAPGLVARTLDGVEMTEMPADWHPPKDEP